MAENLSAKFVCSRRYRLYNIGSLLRMDNS